MGLRIGLKAVLVRDDKILLLRRVDAIARGGTWDLPGGLIKTDEKLHEGLRREVFEETGIKISNVDVPLDIGYFNDGEYKIQNVIRVIYLSFVDEKEVKLSREHYEFKWVTIEDLRVMNKDEFISPNIFYQLVERLDEVLRSKVKGFREKV